MNIVYAASACVAIAATIMVITRRNAVHALLYLVVSLLAVAVIMFLLGAAFVAALEVIIYAGAIMVLFVFVIMLIGPRNDTVSARTWIGPVILGMILLIELVYVVTSGQAAPLPAKEVTPRQVGIALLGPYLIGVEVTAFLLLAGLIGAFHLGRRLAVSLGRKGDMMASVPFEYGLAVAGVLFVLGLAGVLVRRNLLFILLSVEIMLNAAGLAFIVAGSRWGQADGQVMFIFLLSMAAAEVAVGLALILLLYGRRKDLDSDSLGVGGGGAEGERLTSQGDAQS